MALPCSIALTRRLVIFIASSKVTKEVYRQNVRKQNALNTVCLLFRVIGAVWSFMHKSCVHFFFLLSLTLMVTGIRPQFLLFYRPLPVGKLIPPGAPPLLHSSSSAWRSALLLSPDQSTHNLEDTVRAHSDRTVTKTNLTDLNVIYCRRLLGSAQKPEE